jgi:hypothetical protein
MYQQSLGLIDSHHLRAYLVAGCTFFVAFGWPLFLPSLDLSHDVSHSVYPRKKRFSYPHAETCSMNILVAVLYPSNRLHPRSRRSFFFITLGHLSSSHSHRLPLFLLAARYGPWHRRRHHGLLAHPTSRLGRNLRRGARQRLLPLARQATGRSRL